MDGAACPSSPWSNMPIQATPAAISHFDMCQANWLALITTEVGYENRNSGRR